jgi:hypothetical protein
MGELTTLIEKVVETSGQDFKLITAGAEVTGLNVHAIVPNAATVFAKITGVGEVNLLTAKSIGSTEIGQGMLLPFYSIKVTNIQLTSGSVLAYYK